MKRAFPILCLLILVSSQAVAQRRSQRTFEDYLDLYKVQVVEDENELERVLEFGVLSEVRAERPFDPAEQVRERLAAPNKRQVTREEYEEAVKTFEDETLTHFVRKRSSRIIIWAIGSLDRELATEAADYVVHYQRSGRDFFTNAAWSMQRADPPFIDQLVELSEHAQHHFHRYEALCEVARVQKLGALDRIFFALDKAEQFAGPDYGDRRRTYTCLGYATEETRSDEAVSQIAEFYMNLDYSDEPSKAMLRLDSLNSHQAELADILNIIDKIAAESSSAAIQQLLEQRDDREELIRKSHVFRWYDQGVTMRHAIDQAHKVGWLPWSSEHEMVKEAIEDVSASWGYEPQTRGYIEILWQLGVVDHERLEHDQFPANYSMTLARIARISDGAFPLEAAYHRYILDDNGEREKVLVEFVAGGQLFRFETDNTSDWIESPAVQSAVNYAMIVLNKEQRLYTVEQSDVYWLFSTPAQMQAFMDVIPDEFAMISGVAQEASQEYERRIIERLQRGGFSD